MTANEACGQSASIVVIGRPVLKNVIRAMYSAFGTCSIILLLGWCEGFNLPLLWDRRSTANHSIAAR